MCKARSKHHIDISLKKKRKLGYLSHDNDDAQTNNEPKSASSNGKDNLINFFNETRKKHIIIIVSIFVEYVFMQVCKDIMQKYVDVD